MTVKTYSPDIPYLHEETAPRHIVDIMRPAADMGLKRGLGHEALCWFLDTVKTDLARTIIEVSTDSSVPKLDEDMRDAGTYDSICDDSIIQPLARLAFTLGLEGQKDSVMRNQATRSIDGNFIRAANDTYKECTEPEQDTKHATIVRILSEEMKLDEDRSVLLERALDPKGSSFVTDQQNDVLKGLAEYVLTRFTSFSHKDLDLKPEQQGILRQLTGEGYQQTDGNSAHRNARTLANVIGLRSKSEARVMYEYCCDALERIVIVKPSEEVSETDELEPIIRKATVSPRKKRAARPQPVKQKIRKPCSIRTRTPEEVEKPVIKTEAIKQLEFTVVEVQRSGLAPEIIEPINFQYWIDAGNRAEDRLLNDELTITDHEKRELESIVRKGRRYEKHEERSWN